jgi:high affinity Mn2+ porin
LKDAAVDRSPWDFTDIDRCVQSGVSINGKSWGRPDDTIGIAGVVNGISNAHIVFSTPAASAS